MSSLFIFINEMFSGIFGGKSGLLVCGLGVSLLAVLGLAECRQGRIEDLSEQMRELTAAHAGQALAIKNLKEERQRWNALLTQREEEKHAVNVELEKARAEAETAGDWLDAPLPDAVQRLFHAGADSASGGGAAPRAAGPAAAGGQDARLARQY